MSCGIILTLTAIATVLRPARCTLRTDGRGPYDVIFTSFEDCGKETALGHYDVGIQKSSENSVTTGGQIVHNFTLTDQIKIKISMHKYQNRGWKEDYMVFEQGNRGVCSSLKMFWTKDRIDSMMSQFSDQNNNTLKDAFEACDVPPGVYTFSGVQFDFPVSKYYPEFAYGRYRTYIMFYSDNVEVGCLLSSFDLVPKKKKKPTK